MLSGSSETIIMIRLLTIYRLTLSDVALLICSPKLFFFVLPGYKEFMPFL